MISLGRLTGHGWGEGPQTQSGRVPEQQTDFIFTVVGEELGFVGTTIVLGLFLALALRVLRVAEEQRPPRHAAGRMVISGRMADVCAELDRLIELENQRQGFRH